MVGYKFKYLVFICCFLIGLTAKAQHLIGNVSVNKNSVYVGEPVEVSVSIYTSTWFTEGVNPGNIKVNDAFTVYFRSLSTSKQINGKTYAGVIMYFNVFPYEEKNIEFPALEFTVVTPNVGDYKGVKKVVKTPSRSINVKSVPPNFDRNQWLVTTYLNVSEHWSSTKNEVKVGDVLERSITRNASGTVSELIPPMVWDSISNVSLYPIRAEVKSNKSKTAISASRTDGIRYLFEKEGTVVIPEKVITWWNPVSKKVFKRTLAAKEITVLPNPDLGMLTTIRDSLQVSVPIESDGIEEDTPFKILGFTIKQFLAILISLLLLIYVLIKYGIRLQKNYQQKRVIYLQSEHYYFNLFIKSISKNDTEKTIQLLYKWVSRLSLESPTLSFFINNFGSELLKNELIYIEKYLNKEKNHVNFNLKNWKSARKNYLKNNGNNRDKLKFWVNP